MGKHKPYSQMNADEKTRQYAYTQKVVDRYQADTIEAGAIMAGEVWTEAEDLELLTSPDRLVEMAITLGRTFHAVQNRHAYLLRCIEAGELVSYAEARRAQELRQRKAAPLLCPCGTQDGDHDTWCPAAV